MRRKTIALMSVMLIALLMPAFAQAGTITWKTQTSGDWSVASNWVGEIVPGASDDVVIPASAADVITVTRSASASSVSVGAGSTLQVAAYDNNGGSWYHSTLTIGSSIGNDGRIELVHTGAGGAGTASVVGSTAVLSNSGTIDVSVGGGHGGRTLAVQLNNAGTINVKYFLTLTSTFTNTGSVNIASGVNCVIASGAAFNQNSGTVEGDGTLVLNGGATASFNAPVSASPPGINMSLPGGNPVIAGKIDNVVMTIAGAYASALDDTTIDTGGRVIIYSYDNNGGNWYHSTLTVGTGFTNKGTIELTHDGPGGAGTAILAGSSVLTNIGAINTTVLMGSGGRTFSVPIDNQGTIDIKYSTNTYTSTLTNTGAVTISSGKAFTIGSNGILNHNPGGSFSGEGTLSLTGSAVANFNAPVATSALGMNIVADSSPTITGALDNAVMTINGATVTASGVTAIGLGGKVIVNSYDNNGGSWWHSTFLVAGALTNNGTIELTHTGAGGAGTATLTGPVGALTNTGTLRSAVGNGRSNRVLSVDMHSEGTISADYPLTCSSKLTNTGTISIAAGSSLAVVSGGAFTHDGGGVEGAGAFVLDGSAIASFNAPVSTTSPGVSMILQNGSPRIAGKIDNVVMTITNASVSASDNTGIGSGGKVIVNSYDNNGGSWWHSTLSVGTGFTNNGTIEITHTGAGGAGTATLTGVAGATLTNTGKIRFSSGNNSGGRTLSVAVNNNGGAIDVDYPNTAYAYTLTNKGVIDIASGVAFTIGSGGILNHNAGTVIGAGALVLSGSGAGNFSVPVSESALGMNVTLLDSSTISGKIDNVVMTVANGTSVHAYANTTIGSGAKVVIWPYDNNGGYWYHSTLTVGAGFTNNGTIELTHTGAGGAGAAALVGASVLTNKGTINIAAGNGQSSRVLDVPVDNTGTIKVDYSSAIYTKTLNNSGAMDIAAGKSFTMGTGGIYNHNTRASISGDGTLVFIGTAAANFNASASRSAYGAHLNAQESSTIAGTIDNAVITVANTGGSTVSASADTTIGQGAKLIVYSYDNNGGYWYHSSLKAAGGFTNNGIIELTHDGAGGAGASILTGAAGALLTNRGKINFAVGNNQSSRSLGLSVNNLGTINVDYSPVSYTSALTNRGTLSIASGKAFTVSSGGAYTHSTGGVVAGAGTLVFNGSAAAKFNAPIAALPYGANLSSQESSTIAGKIDNVVMTVANTGGSTVSASPNTTIGLGAKVSICSYDNNGGYWYHSTLTVGKGFINNGTIELMHTGSGGAGSITLAGATGTTLINNGTINSVAGNGGAVRSLSVPVDNRKAITVDYPMTCTGAIINRGVVTIAGGQTLTMAGGTFNNALLPSRGTLQGTGALNVSGVTFSSAGNINPGTSPGILSIIGNVPMTQSNVLNIEVGGATPGNSSGNHDQLIVTGNSTLSGTLAVRLVEGFAPDAGDTFKIMKYGSHTGQFAKTVFPGQWSVAYNVDSVDLTFKGGTITPTVVTSSISGITGSTASGGGNVTSDGGASVTARGVCWSTLADPTTANTCTSDGAGTGAFTSSLTGLSRNTLYHVRAYATNSAGTAYGSDVTFTTQASIPTLTALPVSKITLTTAATGGKVTSDGGASVTARGVCWSTTANPVVGGSCTNDGMGAGVFTSIITGLTPNTRYHVRAYATNTAGTGYTTDTAFTTLADAPVAATATAVLKNSFTANWNAGVAPVTGYLLDVSTDINFGKGTFVGAYHDKAIAGVGAKSCPVTGLSAKRTYFYRLRAVNAGGKSAYSNIIKVVTDTTPTVYAPTSSGLGTTAATLGATITSDGGDSVSGSGVAYGSKPNPDITGTKVATSPLIKTGAFKVKVTKLSANTLYHYRGYAANSVGTGYTLDATFTTLPGAPTAIAATGVNATGFTANWKAPSGTATIRGYRLDVATNAGFTAFVPGYKDLFTVGTSKAVTGLSTGATYYYRVRAINAGGVSSNSNTVVVTGVKQSFTISGTIKSGRFPLAGVTVSLSGDSSETFTTGVNGTYRFSNKPDGAYTITLHKTLYTFSPASLSVRVSGADVTGQDFSGVVQSASVHISLPGAASTSPSVKAYRMIGIPVIPRDPDSFVTLSPFWGGHHDTSLWRLFAPNYSEITESGQDVITHGKGWWTISTEPKEIVITGIPLTHDFECRVVPGYQMIGCPYSYTSIPWSNVLADPRNGSLQLGKTVYSWDGNGEYVGSPKLEPGKAYLVSSKSSGTLYISSDYPQGSADLNTVDSQGSKRGLELLTTTSSVPESETLELGVTQSPPPLSPASFIQVTSPKEGEVLKAGGSYAVRWQSLGISPEGFVSKVKITFSADDGKSYSVIVAEAAAGGSFQWKVPGKPTKQGSIKVTSMLYPQLSARSGMFTVK